MLRERLRVEQSYSDAAMWFRTAADLNDPRAMVRVASRWPRRGCDSVFAHFHPCAAVCEVGGAGVWQVKLGRYCEEGQGVPRDSEVAVRLYRTAAERCKNVDAMMQLARCFVDGVGVQPSAAMAAWWHQQAASAVRSSLQHPHTHTQRGGGNSPSVSYEARRVRGKRCVWSNDILV